MIENFNISDEELEKLSKEDIGTIMYFVIRKYQEVVNE